MCDSLDFRVIFIALTMYSGRRGEAVAAVDAGIERLNFQAVEIGQGIVLTVTFI